MLHQADARRGWSVLLRVSGCNCHNVSLLPCAQEPLMSKHCFVMGTQDCRDERRVFLTRLRDGDAKSGHEKSCFVMGTQDCRGQTDVTIVMPLDKG